MLQQSPSPQRVARPVPPPRTPASDDGPLAEGREFVWSDADFSRIKALIYKKAGISLHDGKHAMVYSRVSRRLRDTGHGSFKSYLDWLEQHDGAEWQEFINALTTNLTAFFRESHHFDILAQHLRSDLGIELGQRVDGLDHLGLDQTAHLEHSVGDAAEFRVELGGKMLFGHAISPGFSRNAQ